jgi:hypothetical protein
MAIKFSAKDQPASPAATAKPVKTSAEAKQPPAASKPADATTEALTDLFKSPAEAPSRKPRKK